MVNSLVLFQISIIQTVFLDSVEQSVQHFMERYAVFTAKFKKSQKLVKNSNWYALIKC